MSLTMATRKTPTGHGALRARRDVELGKRGEQRARQFIEAATEVFLEKGYRNARLADIVARTGGSLATLYRVFGDRISETMRSAAACSARSGGRSVSRRMSRPSPKERMLPSMIAWTRPSLSPKTR